MQNLNRRNFLTGLAACSPALVLPTIFMGTSRGKAADPIPLEVVKEYVRVSHGDVDRTKALLNEYPHLIHASWDWGDGDFETGIGAAGHVGHRELALFFLENGARADIFVLTMLGETGLVKSMLKKYPQLLKSVGPHGLSLLHHAEKGGEPAAELLKHIKKLGLTEKKISYFNK